MKHKKKNIKKLNFISKDFHLTSFLASIGLIFMILFVHHQISWEGVKFQQTS